MGRGRRSATLGAAVALAAVAFTATGSIAHGRTQTPEPCPVGVLPLRAADLPPLRRFALTLAPHGASYRDAKATIRLPTFFTGYVRAVCPKRLVARVIARTADARLQYPHITFSASLSFSVFLVSQTRRGFVAWAQIH
jgi:hypothetical protein